MQLDQLEILSYVYATIIHQPITVSANTFGQMHVQIKRCLTDLQDLIPALASAITYISCTSQK